jgi:radical SAM protein with 4Fe4S-binding SPASM domain
MVVRGGPGRRKGIRNLELILSSACNLACSYCYQNDKKRGRLAWDAARAALDFALDDSPDELGIHFLGGEPLLEFETIRRAVEHAEDRCRPGKRLTFHVGTNGLLLGEDRAAFFAHHRFELHLSFDGVPEAQRLRGERTFARLDALLDRLCVEHPEQFRDRLTISLTFLPSTLEHLPASLCYFLAKGVRSIGLSPQATDTSWWNPARIGELEAVFRELFDISVEHFHRTGDVPLRIFRRGSGPNELPPTERSMCGVGEGENLTVDADGEVYGCVTFARSYQRLPAMLERRLEPMRLGPVASPALDSKLATYPKQARRAEIFDHQELKRSSYGSCRECRWLATCSICPVSIGQQRGNEDPHRVPDFLCAYNLVVHPLRERFPAVQRFGPPADDASLPDFLRRIRLVAGSLRATREESA